MSRVIPGPLLFAFLALSVCGACPQGMGQHVPSTAACVDLNQMILTQVANGEFAAAEATLANALTSGIDRGQSSCSGFVLSNMAALTAISGRIAESENFAERSVKILEKIYSPDDPVLLRPLQILAATRFEQGKMSKAREAFKRMQLIRTQRSEDSALVHGIAASLLQAEGRRKEAEEEFLAALHACAEAGQNESAYVGSILNSLGSLYIEERRLDEARRTLDQAVATFRRAPDAVPLDRIKLLQLRGVLHARQGEWREAEQDLHEALSMADREAKVDSVVLRSLLSSYAVVLRKNHRGREARSFEARVAALGRDHTTDNVVDITDLLAKSKHVTK